MYAMDGQVWLWFFCPDDGRQVAVWYGICSEVLATRNMDVSGD